MRESFLETVPSRFENMTDSENSAIDISTSDIVDAKIGVNGLVYVTNTVYPPDDYVSFMDRYCLANKPKFSTGQFAKTISVCI